MKPFNGIHHCLTYLALVPVIWGQLAASSATATESADIFKSISKMRERDTLETCFANFRTGVNITTIPAKRVAGRPVEVASYGGIYCRHDRSPATFADDGRSLKATDTYRIIDQNDNIPVEIFIHAEAKKPTFGENLSTIYIDTTAASRLLNSEGRKLMWRYRFTSETLDIQTRESKVILSKTIYRYCNSKVCKPPNKDDSNNLRMESRGDIALAEMIVQIEQIIFSISGPFVFSELTNPTQQKTSTQASAAVSSAKPRYIRTNTIFSPELMLNCINGSRLFPDQFVSKRGYLTDKVTCQHTNKVAGGMHSITYELESNTQSNSVSNINEPDIAPAIFRTVIEKRRGTPEISAIRVEGVNYSPDGERAWIVVVTAPGENDAPSVASYYNCPSSAGCDSRNMTTPQNMGVLEAAVGASIENVARNILLETKPQMVAIERYMREASFYTVFFPGLIAEKYTLHAPILSTRNPNKLSR